MIDISDSVVDDARQYVASHIKKNIYESFNFRINDVMSMSLMLSLFNPRLAAMSRLTTAGRIADRIG
jgi:hypothetical protein